MAPNENPGQGHEYPPVEVSWLQRDVLLFAVSIGATVDELNFIYVRAFCVTSTVLPRLFTNITTGTAPQIRRISDISHHSSI
jgi:hypothetical protein